MQRNSEHALYEEGLVDEWTGCRNRRKTYGTVKKNRRKPNKQTNKRFTKIVALNAPVPYLISYHLYKIIYCVYFNAKRHFSIWRSINSRT